MLKKAASSSQWACGVTEPMSGFRFGGQCDSKRGAFSHRAFHLDVPPVQTDKVFDDGQAKPEAFHAQVVVAVGLKKGFEEIGEGFEKECQARCLIPESTILSGVSWHNSENTPMLTVPFSGVNFRAL